MSRFKNRKNNNRSMPADNFIINDKIKTDRVFVIDQNGEKLGEIDKAEALKIASDSGLDLVQVGGGEKGANPTAKIMDFGKFLYTKKKQLSESKKKQKIIQIKEIKLRPNIGDHDYLTKLNRAITFLKEGKKVKFTLQFRGRQFIMINQLGRGLFDRIKKNLEEQDLGTLVMEKEQRGGPYWSKIYFLK